jgi:hypothetical protein
MEKLFKQVFIKSQDDLPKEEAGRRSELYFVGCGDSLDVAFYDFEEKKWINHEFDEITDPEYYIIRQQPLPQEPAKSATELDFVQYLTNLLYACYDQGVNSYEPWKNFDGTIQSKESILRKFHRPPEFDKWIEEEIDLLVEYASQTSQLPSVSNEIIAKQAELIEFLETFVDAQKRGLDQTVDNYLKYKELKSELGVLNNKKE